MNKASLTCAVYDATGTQPLAHIAIDELNPLHDMNGGAMLRFAIVRGGRRLWQQWFDNKPIIVRSADGLEGRARLAAFPTTSDGHGYLEFI